MKKSGMVPSLPECYTKTFLAPREGYEMLSPLGHVRSLYEVLYSRATGKLTSYVQLLFSTSVDLLCTTLEPECSHRFCCGKKDSIRQIAGAQWLCLRKRSQLS